MHVAMMDKTTGAFGPSPSSHTAQQTCYEKHSQLSLAGGRTCHMCMKPNASWHECPDSTMGSIVYTSCGVTCQRHEVGSS